MLATHRASQALVEWENNVALRECIINKGKGQPPPPQISYFVLYFTWPQLVGEGSYILAGTEVWNVCPSGRKVKKK